MKKIARFGVSLERGLLEKFDDLIVQMGYKNRSEAIRDLIREKLVEEEWKDDDKECVGILGLIYNHDTREITETLIRIQHQNIDVVITSTHIHLDHHNCLEVILLRGKSALIRRISHDLLSTRSVKHGKLLMTTTGRDVD